MARQRKMVDITVEETSGVDHPAHLHEGWVVCKSAPAARVEEAFGSLNTTKEGPVPTIKKNEDGTVSLSQEEYDALAAVKAEAEAKAAAEAEAKAKAEAEAAPAEGAAPAAGEGEDVAKAAAAREAMDKAVEAATAGLRAELAKERDVRLDGEAITKSRATFKSLGINHDEVAPALRRVALIDEGLAKAVETALKAADGQLESAGILFKEVGGTGTTNTENALEKAAKALVEKGVVGTYSQGVAKALELDPSLYAAYTTKKEGK